MPKKQANGPKANQQVAQRKQKKTVLTNPSRGPSQIGAAYRTKMPRIGFSDLRGHRISWILGYIFVGDGTNGAVDNVFFQTASGTYLAGSAATTNPGAIPILGADANVGASYISDVEKHYARKVIKSMRLHVASIQPSTANNMMCVVAPSRGQGLAELSIVSPLATAAAVQRPFTNVMSMDDAMTVDSFETKSLDITRYIAGGSGSKQNEFEIANSAGTATVFTSGAIPAQDLDGIVPACIVVSGNSTTTALRNTRTHVVIIEQVVDLLDFIGGSTVAYPVGVDETTSSSTKMSALHDDFTELVKRVKESL